MHVELERMAIEDVGANPERLAKAIHDQLPGLEGAVPVYDIARALDIEEIRDEALSGFHVRTPAVVALRLRLPWRRRSLRSSGKRHQRSAYRPIVRFRSICRKPGAGRGCRSVVSVDS